MCAAHRATGRAPVGDPWPGSWTGEFTRAFTGARGHAGGSPCRCRTHCPRRNEMAVTTDLKADAVAIRPFTIDVPEGDLEDMRARIAATRWPEKETVDDASQGVQLEMMQ